MNLLQKIESDFRAEVIAAHILNNEADFGKVIIERLGSIARTHTKDVYSSHEQISKINLDIYTVLQSFRQSIYEAIPESVFHPPTLGGLGRSTEDIIKEIRLQRKKEYDARTFFKPFEQEAPYLEIYGLMTELMFEKKGTYDSLYLLFQQAWPVIKRLPRSVALSFIYILPILSEVRGKREWIENCLSFITGYPVNIKEVFEPIVVEKKQEGFVAGMSTLGVTSTFGGLQNDGFLKWIVVVGPVPVNQTEGILPQSGFEDLLNTLLEYMAPANIFVQNKIIIDSHGPIPLTDDSASGRLGYSFTI